MAEQESPDGMKSEDRLGVEARAYLDEAKMRVELAIQKARGGFNGTASYDAGLARRALVEAIDRLDKLHRLQP